MSDTDTVEFRSGRYLTFRVGRHELAIWAAAVKSVLPAHEISSSDDGSATITTCGETVPVMDLQAKLSLRGGVVGRLPSIIVVNTGVVNTGVADSGSGLAAFFADGISEVVHAHARDFRSGKLRIGRPRVVVDVAVLRGDPVHST